jgi:ATP-dependent DNA helicase RecG
VPRDVTVASKEYAYYIRHYANSVVAKNGELREFMALTATVPFDDRINHHADLDDLKLPLIRSFLKEVRSDLFSQNGDILLFRMLKESGVHSAAEPFPTPSVAAKWIR